MIEDLVRKCFSKKTIKIFLQQYTKQHYTKHFFADCMKENQGKEFKKYLKKEGYKAETATKLMSLDLVESDIY